MVSKNSSHQLLTIHPSELNRMSVDELKSLKARLRDVIKDAELSLRTNVEEIGGRKVFRRYNKNRPVEMSSKVPRMSKVPKMSKVPALTVRKVEEKRRDPRFEEACGAFDPERFKKRYSFLEEMREKEKRIVVRRMKREKDPEKKKRLEKVVQGMKGQQVTEEEKERKRQIAERLREEAIKSSGRPFLNKSYVKKFSLVDKFQQLKRTGKLDKYIEKKRKKLLNTARKKYDV